MIYALNCVYDQFSFYLRTYCDASPLKLPLWPPMPGPPKPGLKHGMPPTWTMGSLQRAAQTPTKIATKSHLCKYTSINEHSIEKENTKHSKQWQITLFYSLSTLCVWYVIPKETDLLQCTQHKTIELNFRIELAFISTEIDNFHLIFVSHPRKSGNN